MIAYLGRQYKYNKAKPFHNISPENVNKKGNYFIIRMSPRVLFVCFIVLALGSSAVGFIRLGSSRISLNNLLLSNLIDRPERPDIGDQNRITIQRYRVPYVSRSRVVRNPVRRVSGYNALRILDAMDM